MNTQPEALRLADELECGQWYAQTNQWKEDAATELRRLHELNQELVEALKGLVQLDEEEHQRGPGDIDICKEVQDAYAALAKASGTATQTGETE